MVVITHRVIEFARSGWRHCSIADRSDSLCGGDGALMKIGFVRVFVSDFNESLRFYTQTLGMKLDYTDNAHWAQFVSGEDVSLAIEKCDPDHMEQGSKLVGRFVGVTMMVDDINAEYARLTAKGVKFSGEPEKQSFGGTLAHLHDLDGNVLTLMQEG